MHVILATIGTDGDIFPYLGLGTMLQARGHRITLAAPECYRARAQAMAMEFCPLVTVAELEQLLADPHFWHPFLSGVISARWGAPLVLRHYDELARLVAKVIRMVSRRTTQRNRTLVVWIAQRSGLTPVVSTSVPL